MGIAVKSLEINPQWTPVSQIFPILHRRESAPSADEKIYALAAKSDFSLPGGTGADCN